jgi:hypothetical protein
MLIKQRLPPHCFQHAFCEASNCSNKPPTLSVAAQSTVFQPEWPSRTISGKNDSRRTGCRFKGNIETGKAQAKRRMDFLCRLKRMPLCPTPFAVKPARKTPACIGKSESHTHKYKASTLFRSGSAAFITPLESGEAYANFASVLHSQNIVSGPSRSSPPRVL